MILDHLIITNNMENLISNQENPCSIPNTPIPDKSVLGKDWNKIFDNHHNNSLKNFLFDQNTENGILKIFLLESVH